MSSLSENDPATDRDCPAGVEVALLPRAVDIGGFKVYRALPSQARQMVGPFIFWDQMGAGAFAAGRGVDVRPHPHIGLATVTYLFEGSLDHRDSLSNDLRILPGDVNLMYAGAGIVHSERTGADVRREASRLFGIQSWMAQPRIHEDGAPGFAHVDRCEIPVFTDRGVWGRLVLGEIAGVVSPIAVQWPSLYAEVKLDAGASLPLPRETTERAVHVLAGEIDIAGSVYRPSQMVVCRPGAALAVRAKEPAHLMLLGGEAMDGPRHIWWNLVSSSLEKIKVAALEWREGKFPTIPGDDKEYIPLPDTPFPKERPAD